MPGTITALVCSARERKRERVREGGRGGGGGKEREGGEGRERERERERQRREKEAERDSERGEREREIDSNKKYTCRELVGSPRTHLLLLRRIRHLRCRGRAGEGRVLRLNHVARLQRKRESRQPTHLLLRRTRPKERERGGQRRE